MKRLLKRWVACLLSLMIMLHSTFLSVSAAYVGYSVSNEGITVYLNDPLLCDYDIVVNPDYLNGITSSTSFGATLSIGQIAALILGGAGAIFTVQNFDTLGTSLSNSLNSAANGIQERVTELNQWFSDSSNGFIALKSAPMWILTCLTQLMHGVVTGSSPIMQEFSGDYSYYSQGQELAVNHVFYVNESGTSYSLTRAGTTVYSVSYVAPYYSSQISGYVYRAYRYHVFLASEGLTTFQYKRGGSYENNTLTDGFGDTLGKRAYFDVSYVLTFDTLEAAVAALPSMSVGAINLGVFDKSISTSKVHSSIGAYVDGTLSSEFPDAVIDGRTDEPAPLDPGILVGGLPEVWVGQGLGADVVTMPDINLDGSDLINVGDQTALDTSIGTTMDKLATGELTWDDYWLDISGSGPLVDVGEGEGEDVGPPLQLPDWFKDWCKDITGTELDRNSEIDSLLPDLDEGMGQIDDFSASIGDQLKTEFDALHIENFALSTSVLLAIGWIAGWVTQFFNASGDAQVVVLLPMFIGLALLFIGRGSVAMSRVHSSHQHDTRKAAVSSKKGGGTP